MTTIDTRTTLPAPDRDDELHRLRAENAGLRERLETAGLRFQVALALLDSLGDHLEDYDDETLVIDEVVRQWRGLDPGVRDGFRRVGSLFGPLMWFAWAWLEGVNEAAFATPPADEAGPAQAEEILARHWRQYLTTLTRRDDSAPGSASPPDRPPPG